MHSCVGGPLARLEVNIALETFLRRVENPRLVVDPPPYRMNQVFRGPLHLEVEFDRISRTEAASRPSSSSNGNGRANFGTCRCQNRGRGRCWSRSAAPVPATRICTCSNYPPDAGRSTLPFTLGHENAGWVETMGPGATGFAPGDPVIVYGPWGCGLCMNCRQGMENYCQTPGKPSPGGLGGTDGGMAEYLLVPSTRYLIPLGDLDPREAAPLTDAGLTSYHAVKRSVHLLGPGSTAVVIGAGGLGQMAIQVLKALCSATTVVAVDTSADKLRIAKDMGADEVLISGDDAVKRIKDITKGQGAELVLDLVGVNPTLTHGGTGGASARPPHHRRGRQRGAAGQLLTAHRTNARSSHRSGAPSPN